MSGGSFCHCPACGKLSILGATCPCGQRTDMPFTCPDCLADVASSTHHAECVAPLDQFDGGAA